MFNESHFPKWMLASAILAATALTGCGPGSRASGAAPSADASSSAAESSASAAAMASNAPPPVALAAAPTPPPPPPTACPKLAAPACPARMATQIRHLAVWTGAHHAWKQARIVRREPAEDQLETAHDRLMGGPGPGFAGGYRMRETERTEVSRVRGGEVIERYREGARGGPDCVNGCIPGWTGDWRGGRYRTAGIDRAGYLVWPGKIEY